MSAHAPGLCDDGEEPYLDAEVSVFHGRGDEWFVLEWWGDAIGFVVSETSPTLYSCDSGPQPAAIAVAEWRGAIADASPDELRRHIGHLVKLQDLARLRLRSAPVAAPKTLDPPDVELGGEGGTE